MERIDKGDDMKLLKITIAFSVLVSLQIAAAQWLNVPPPVEARNLMVLGGGTPVAAPAHTNYTSDANCIAAYLMTGNNTSETDVSGHSQTLSEESGSMPTSTTVPAGYAGTSRDFTASDTEALTRVDGGDAAGNAITLVAWIKSDVDTGADEGIIEKWTSYHLYVTSADVVRCEITSSSYRALGVTDVIDQAWHHIACVANGTDIRIYIDGVLDSNGSNNPYTSTADIGASDADLWVGSRDGRNNPFDGLIDEVAIFTRALSASEITEIYTYGIDGKNGSDG